jgi:hypothetical protein
MLGAANINVPVFGLVGSSGLGADAACLAVKT